MKATGTKDEVWDGLARRTRGGLMKKHLMVNKRGKVVSKLKSQIAKKGPGFKKLQRLGYA